MRHLLLALLLCVTPAVAETPPAKKGWGGNAATATELKARWYYNWTPRGASSPELEFVPMVKGKWDVKPETLAAIKASGAKVLLGFNEPERASQGNVTVEEALELWPKLMETGLRLGSPSPSSDGPGMAWLDKFMEGAKKRKLRVDFLALHWYRSANPDDLETWLEEQHRKHRLPIWLTEFNAQYSGGDRDRFAGRAFDILRRKRAVERFAYFTTAPGQPGSLWKAPGVLAPLGEDYVKH